MFFKGGAYTCCVNIHECMSPTLDGSSVLERFERSLSNRSKYATEYSISQGLVKGSRSSVWTGVDSYSASELSDALSLRLNTQPKVYGKL